MRKALIASKSSLSKMLLDSSGIGGSEVATNGSFTTGRADAKARPLGACKRDWIAPETSGPLL